MNHDPNDWKETATYDLAVARWTLESGYPTHAAFWCQQAAEKALKGTYLDHTGVHLRTHNLVHLAEELGAPSQIVEYCAELSALYVGARYPDSVETYTVEDVERYLDQAREVVSWTKRS